MNTFLAYAAIARNYLARMGVGDYQLDRYDLIVLRLAEALAN